MFATATIVGTTVGAGIFAIPYVVSQSGIVPGFFYFVIIGAAVLLLHLFFGEIVLRTQEQHRLIGYAQLYLGDWGKVLITFSTLFGLAGTLLAYIVLGGDFLHTIFSSWVFSANNWSIFLAIILSFFIFRGIKLIAPLEMVMNIIFIGIIFFIFATAIPHINLGNFVLAQTENIFLPYGVLLFAFAGWLAIPEAAVLLNRKEERKKLFGVIIAAAFIVAIIYALFIFAVVGISGNNTSEDALSGLISSLGYNIVIFGAIFGVIAVASSFLVLGNYLKNALHYDYKVPRVLAALLACGIPLILFILGFREFIFTIGLVGSLIGATEGIVIILIFQKAKKLGIVQPEYSLNIPKVLLYFLAALFILGSISYILYTL